MQTFTSLQKNLLFVSINMAKRQIWTKQNQCSDSTTGTGSHWQHLLHSIWHMNPCCASYSTRSTMPPRMQAALCMGMILLISVSLLLFDFLLKEELQQDWWHEEDEFIECVAQVVLSRSHWLCWLPKAIGQIKGLELTWITTKQNSACNMTIGALNHISQIDSSRESFVSFKPWQIASFWLWLERIHYLLKRQMFWETQVCFQKCCIIFHNMMVSEWVAWDEPENTSWYKCTNEDDDEDNNTEQLNDPDLEYVEHHEAELDCIIILG